MDCPECGAPAVVTDVPDALRAHAPAPTVAVCSSCLAVSAADDGAREEDDPDAPASVSAISEALPTNREAALALFLAADRMGSLATNRAAVASLVARVEGAGVDATLALERLARDPALDPRVDLRRRVRQFEQLR